MTEIEKNDIFRSSAGIKYIVVKVGRNRVSLVRSYGISRGFEVFDVSKKDLEEWKKS